MNQAQLQAAAKLIAQHRLSCTSQPTQGGNLQPIDINEGYQLQLEVHRILEDSALGRVVGHKIGATNVHIQTQLGVHHPCAGGVYAHTVHQGKATLRMADYVRPGIECEIAFRFGYDLPARTEPYTREDLVQAIDACMVAMEIIDNRYEDLAKIHIPTLIADDTLDAGIVLGEPRTDWRELDLDTLVGTTRLNGMEAGRGTGADVLGHPLNAMEWIANLFSLQGRKLVKGEFVSTGSIADIVWAKSGDRIVAEVEMLGSVEAYFE